MKPYPIFLIFIFAIFHLSHASWLVENLFEDDSSSDEDPSSSENSSDDPANNKRSFWSSLFTFPDYTTAHKLPMTSQEAKNDRKMLEAGLENVIKYVKKRQSEGKWPGNRQGSFKSSPEAQKQDQEKSEDHIPYEDVRKDPWEAKKHQGFFAIKPDFNASQVEYEQENPWTKLENIGFEGTKPDFNASQVEFLEDSMKNKVAMLRSSMNLKKEGKIEAKVEPWEVLEPVGFEGIEPEFNVTGEEEERQNPNCCSCAGCWDENSVLGSESNSVAFGRWNRHLFKERNFTDTSFACGDQDPLGIKDCDCNLDNNSGEFNKLSDEEKTERRKRCCCGIAMAVKATPMLTCGCGCGCGCGIAMAVKATPMMIMGCGCGGGYGYWG